MHLKMECTEPLSSTGLSWFAIQTTVGVEDLFNHMAKQKALSPTGKPRQRILHLLKPICQLVSQLIEMCLEECLVY